MSHKAIGHNECQFLTVRSVLLSSHCSDLKFSINGQGF